MSSKDNETVEIFELMDEASKARRAAHRANAPKLLVEAGVSFSTHNDGAHLIVHGKISTVDFWPGTGRWKERGGRYGFGIFKLLAYLKAAN